MPISSFRRRRLALPIVAVALACAMDAAYAQAQTRIEQGARLISYQLRPTPEGSGLDAVFRVELRDPGMLDPTGGRSISGELALNCAAGLTRLKTMTVHADPGLKGRVVREAPRQTAWVRPEMSSLARVIMNSACKNATPTVAAARPTGSAAAEAAPAPAPIQRPAAPPVERPAPTMTAPASAPAKSATPLPAPRRAGGAYRIQVGSFAQPAEAEAQARRIGAAAGLSGARLETARVNGSTYHRVLFDGFGDRAEAEAACRAVRGAGAPCLVKSAPRN
jgi:cell division septation protein DedD